MAETRSGKKVTDVEQILMGHAEPPADFFSTIRWLDMSTLLVDRDYQHRPYARAVQELAREFNPRISGLILVNIRADGQAYVLDGQTRLEVHRIRGYRWILAQILEGLSQQEEAAIYLFKCLNVQRQPLDFFLAECTAGKDEALLLQALLKKRGIQAQDYATTVVDKSANMITCIATLKRLLRKDPKGEILGATLDLIGDTWGYNKTMLSLQPISVMHALLMRFADVMDRKSFIEKLTGFSWVDIRSDARRLREATSPAPTLGFALMRKIVELYNLGRTRRRLDLGS